MMSPQPERHPGLEQLAFTADTLSGQEIPTRPWHVETLVPSRVVTLLQGDGGTGKSILALQLAVATVTGRKWLGQDVRRGNALYLSAEDDRGELHRRLDGICIDLGIGFDDLPGLKIVDVTGADAVLAAADRTGRLLPTARWQEFERLTEAWEPTLIVVDNLADVFAGEENSRPQARQFIAQLQGCAARCDASLMLLGHPSLAGMASGTGSSGSTAWNNSVRSRLYLERPKLDGELGPPDARVLSVKKANYAPSGLELRLRWSAGVFKADDDTGPLRGIDAQIAERALEQTFLRLLDEYEAQGRRVSDMPSSRYAPTVFARDPSAKGATRRGLEAAMNRLFTAGEIHVEMVGRASKQARRLARKAD